MQRIVTPLLLLLLSTPIVAQDGCPDIDLDTGMTADAVQHCQDLISNGCPEELIAPLSWDPIEYTCMWRENIGVQSEVKKYGMEREVEVCSFTPDGECLTDSNYEQCMDLVLNQGCDEELIDVLDPEECPLTFVCKDAEVKDVEFADGDDVYAA